MKFEKQTSEFDFVMYFDTDINECESSPCQNDGTCNDQINGYSCTCSDGYNGLLCENGMLLWFL